MTLCALQNANPQVLNPNVMPKGASARPQALVDNRYPRVAEGEGEAIRAGSRTTIAERCTYDGISLRVLAFGDWFEGDAAWPAIAGTTRTALLTRTDGDAARHGAIEAATTPDALRTATHEPVFSGDGPVMGFDVLLPATGDTGMQRVRVPLEAISAHLAAAHRKSVDAAAASE